MMVVLPLISEDKLNGHSGAKEYIEYGENERTPGSVSFVPSVAGLIIAGEVIKDLIKE